MNRNIQGPFRTNSTIILASGSPRRRELLADLGLDFEIHPSEADEPPPQPNEIPLEYVKKMAKMKTMDVAAQYAGKTVLGADTIVVLKNRIMGKPSDKLDALEMLSALSGQTHQVITGFCLVLPDGNTILNAVSTDVDMRLSSETELKGYIETGEPMDKAGAYAIQGIGTFLVTGIRGSYTNVVGLPVARILDTLMETKIISARLD
ncbi:MAG: septum formation protein Maf [Pseudodesulfovibrio sp.]|nr:septum formation protein Maf [Pseudodesulfovibrio sp.]